MHERDMYDRLADLEDKEVRTPEEEQEIKNIKKIIQEIENESK